MLKTPTQRVSLVPPPRPVSQNANPLLKMASAATKIRTLRSKWQLERQNYEPFAQGAPKVLTLCSKSIHLRPGVVELAWGEDLPSPYPPSLPTPWPAKQPKARKNMCVEPESALTGGTG